MGERDGVPDCIRIFIFILMRLYRASAKTG